VFTIIMIGLVYFILSIASREMVFSDLLIASVGLVLGYKALRFSAHLGEFLKGLFLVVAAVFWGMTAVILIRNWTALEGLRELVPGWMPNIQFTEGEFLSRVQWELVKPYNVSIPGWHFLIPVIGLYIIWVWRGHSATFGLRNRLRRTEEELQQTQERVEELEEERTDAEAPPAPASAPAATLDPDPAPAAPAHRRPALPPVSPSPRGTPPPAPPAASAS